MPHRRRRRLRRIEDLPGRETSHARSREPVRARGVRRSRARCRARFQAGRCFARRRRARHGHGRGRNYRRRLLHALRRRLRSPQALQRAHGDEQRGGIVDRPRLRLDRAQPHLHDGLLLVGRGDRRSRAAHRGGRSRRDDRRRHGGIAQFRHAQSVGGAEDAGERRSRRRFGLMQAFRQGSHRPRARGGRGHRRARIVRAPREARRARAAS